LTPVPKASPLVKKWLRGKIRVRRGLAVFASQALAKLNLARLYYRFAKGLFHRKTAILLANTPSKNELILVTLLSAQYSRKYIVQKSRELVTVTRQIYHEWRQSLEKQDERAFMPAALEIIETAASPSGRKMMHLIMLIVTTFALWSWFGEVDIVAVAPQNHPARAHAGDPAARSGHCQSHICQGWPARDSWHHADRAR
jgi:hypothetical protein